MNLRERIVVAGAMEGIKELICLPVNPELCETLGDSGIRGALCTISESLEEILKEDYSERLGKRREEMIGPGSQDS